MFGLLVGSTLGGRQMPELDGIRGTALENVLPNHRSLQSSACVSTVSSS